MADAEPEARPHPEHVVLEIGGEIGALVVHAEPRDLDLQIEICASGEEKGKRAHQHVLERPMPARTMYAAVFYGLRQGSYTLLTHNQVRETAVMIRGGEVTTIDWRRQRESPTQSGDGA
jgi:hypothetical protein